MSSRFKSLRGRTTLIGQGIPQDTSTLDPEVFEGSIVFTTSGQMRYSDGSEWVLFDSNANTGPEGAQGAQGTQGVQGDYGPGFTIVGETADGNTSVLESEFPGSNVGDGVIDQSDDTLWIYVGGTDLWVNIGSFRGVQGFTGAQGAQGVQGDLGEEGIQGSRGFRGYQGVQGIQGYTGIQGSQGTQGIQGVQGPQASQGVQGIQGVQGLQGIQGVQGPQGVQGTQGFQGDLGVQGWQGADSGLVLTFNLSNDITEADPGTGGVRFNSASANTDDFSAVTQIWMDDADNHNIDIQGLLTAMDGATSANKGYLKFTKRDEPARYVIFSVQELTEETGYWELDVTYISGLATKEDFTELTTPPSTYTSYPLVVAFDIAGDRGVQGFRGPQAFQGIQGTQGWQGVQGVQGPQAFQGIQGFQGLQGTQGVQGVQGLQGVQGVQGYNGIQGSQGVQGWQGVQGTQGVQGVQGTQGVQGFVGDTGSQGAQGVQGTQGIQGLQGIMGNYGGLTYEWNFDNDTTASTSPGTNNWKINSADVSTATILTIDDVPLNNYSNEIDEVFDWLDTIPGGGGSKGLLVIESYDDGNGPGGHHQVVYEFTDVEGQGSGNTHYTFDVSYVGKYGLPNSNWQQDVIDTSHPAKTVISFVPRGAAGVQGTTGFQGFQGVQGVQGVQGIQGVQGTQGLQGTQGAQGISGAYGGASFEYDFTPDTSVSGPASGLFKLNNTDITSATVMRMSDTDTFGTNLDAFLRTVSLSSSAIKAYIRIVSVANSDEFVLYSLSASAEQAAYYNFTVSYLAKSSSMDATYLTNNTDVVISFSTSGDAGGQGVQGVQGVQGIQGWYGFQGTQGVQGPQAAQGTQGFQGDLGFQGFPGSVGPRGAQGFTGIQGDYGFQGATGSFGGATFDYTWSTNTAATDPGVGYAKINNANATSASILFIDERDDNFTDVRSYLQTIDDSTSAIKGHVKITDKVDPSQFMLFAINGASTYAGGYFAVDVSYVSGSVSSTFVNDNDITLTFARTGDIGDPGIQGSQGVQGLQGTQGVQGDTGAGEPGPQGVQGVQGVQGFSGNLGAVGAQGMQGFQGVQGWQGTAGLDGEGGIQGTQGFQGYTGFQGMQGTQGVQGYRGTDGIGASGIQGNQGVQGVQGSQAAQGTQGIQGDPGTGFQGVQGNQGFQGFDGGPGAQGADGTGNQGTQGRQGTQGFTGGPGPQGFSGDLGAQGATGAQGIDGDEGAQGFQGTPGEGNQGTQGFQGFTGLGGDEGAQGFQGPQGFQGANGDTGEGGVQGYTGIQGFTGIQGTGGGVGVQGDGGSQGFQGDYGFQGFDGGTGPQGTQGRQGVQGVQGWYGFQGTTGAGTQGIQGVQGIQGDFGIQGTQGVQGFGNSGGVGNLQNVHESAVQDTSLFIAMFEGGAEQRPLLGTTGPNPGGESNFYYVSDEDTLYAENLELGGNLTATGTVSAAQISGITNDLQIPNDVNINFGTTTQMALSYESSTGNFAMEAAAGTQRMVIENSSGTALFTFGIDTGGGDLTATGDVTTNSDIRLKEQIVTVDNALEKVSNMRGVYFNKKSQPDLRKIGLIAQEVEKVIPEAVIEDNSEDRIKSVSYGNLVGLLVEAVKDLKEEIDTIKSK